MLVDIGAREQSDYALNRLRVIGARCKRGDDGRYPRRQSIVNGDWALVEVTCRIGNQRRRDRRAESLDQPAWHRWPIHDVVHGGCCATGRVMAIGPWSEPLGASGKLRCGCLTISLGRGSSTSRYGGISLL